MVTGQSSQSHSPAYPQNCQQTHGGYLSKGADWHSASVSHFFPFSYPWKQSFLLGLQYASFASFGLHTSGGLFGSGQTYSHFPVCLSQAVVFGQGQSAKQFPQCSQLSQALFPQVGGMIKTQAPFWHSWSAKQGQSSKQSPQFSHLSQKPLLKQKGLEHW